MWVTIADIVGKNEDDVRSRSLVFIPVWRNKGEKSGDRGVKEFHTKDLREKRNESPFRYRKNEGMFDFVV
jgi:hypothetical protein